MRQEKYAHRFGIRIFLVYTTFKSRKRQINKATAVFVSRASPCTAKKCRSRQQLDVLGNFYMFFGPQHHREVVKNSGPGKNMKDKENNPSVRVKFLVCAWPNWWTRLFGSAKQGIFLRSCLVLSYLLLSCLAIPSHVFVFLMSYRVLASLVLSFFVLSRHVLFCHVFSSLALPCLVVSCRVLSYLALSCLAIPSHVFVFLMSYLVLASLVSFYLVLSRLIFFGLYCPSLIVSFPVL